MERWAQQAPAFADPAATSRAVADLDYRPPSAGAPMVHHAVCACSFKTLIIIIIIIIIIQHDTSTLKALGDNLALFICTDLPVLASA